MLELEPERGGDAAGGAAGCGAELAEVRAAVRSEKLGEVAAEFDGVHSIQRALAVGSVDRIIAGAELRPYLVDAIERGLARELGEASAELVHPGVRRNGASQGLGAHQRCRWGPAPRQRRR